jgi:hypothetical protein
MTGGRTSGKQIDERKKRNQLPLSHEPFVYICLVFLSCFFHVHFLLLFSKLLVFVKQTLYSLVNIQYLYCDVLAGNASDN